jgi:NADH dehydrogenase
MRMVALSIARAATKEAAGGLSSLEVPGAKAREGQGGMGSESKGSGIITVFGGPGFVGRYAVRALAKDGWRVRAASRRPDLAGHLQPMGDVGQTQPVQANLRYPDSVRRAVEGAYAVVNSVGVLASTGRQSFKAIHVNGARAVAKAAREAGAERLVHISAIGADRKSPARYARSKAEGEAAVLAEFPAAVILRPSIVFGPEDDFFNRFAAMARISPVLPLIGGGRTKFQPVFVGDLAAAVAAVVGGAGRPGTIYEIGGPEVLTFRELLDRTQEYTGRKRFYLSMPFWLAKLQALLTWPLPNRLRPITYDQVRLLQRDNVVSEAAEREGRTLAALAVPEPHAIGAIVPAYLERFKPRGQFSHYRS